MRRRAARRRIDAETGPGRAPRAALRDRPDPARLRDGGAPGGVQHGARGPAAPPRTRTRRRGGSAAGAAGRLASQVAVIVSDTFGRPWRIGPTDIAIGVAGAAPLETCAAARHPRQRARRDASPRLSTSSPRRPRSWSRASSARPGGGGPRTGHMVTAEDGPGAQPWSARPTRTCSGYGSRDVASRAAPSGNSPTTPWTRRRSAARWPARADGAGSAPHHAVAVRRHRRQDAADPTADAMPRRGWPTCGPTASARSRLARRVRRGDVLRGAPCVVPCLAREGTHHDRTEAPAAEREMFVVATGRRGGLPGRARRRGTGLGVGVVTMFCRPTGRRCSTCPGTGTRWVLSRRAAAATPPDRPPRDPGDFMVVVRRGSHRAVVAALVTRTMPFPTYHSSIIRTAR